MGKQSKTCVHKLPLQTLNQGQTGPVTFVTSMSAVAMLLIKASWEEKGGEGKEREGKGGKGKGGEEKRGEDKEEEREREGREGKKKEREGRGKGRVFLRSF